MKTMKTMKRAIPLVEETCIRARIGESFQKKLQAALCTLSRFGPLFTWTSELCTFFYRIRVTIEK